MKAVLIFAGTTEGRELAQLLSASGICCMVCVATEYGKIVMPELDGVQVSVGRLNGEQMRGLTEEGYRTDSGGVLEYGAVVDATHPYATEVSDNIKRSLNNLNIPYLRLKRDGNPGVCQNEKSIRCFDSHEDCAKALAGTEGNILLTTGSSALSVYCSDALKERLYVRTLPSQENIAACEAQGICGKQMIAMQGPFSAELNLAMVRQFDIRHIVTKESGTNGGFAEKMRAAEEAEIQAWVIGQPKESGLPFSEVVKQLQKLLGTDMMKEAKVEVSLIGIGMGVDTMSIAACRAMENADFIFGAERMLACAPAGKEKYPYYQADDIVSVLLEKKKENFGKTIKAVVLLSGDVGFYSGAKKIKEGLNKNGFHDICLYAGTSSVSYLAAAAGESWEDAKILSIHGRKDVLRWRAELVDFVMYNPRTFVLVSGVEDIPRIGEMLTDAGLGTCILVCGYQLSYKEERIQTLPAKEAASVTRQGLYTLLVKNPAPQKKMLTPMLADADFIREKVPMTKEEIRQVAVCKLGLTGQAVVYDIGSGTGSIAVECARCSPDIRVYAVDKKQEAVELVKKNRAKFHLQNVIPVLGDAVDVLQNLVPPTHVFIGGSGGKMRKIIETVWEKNAGACIVATAVSLETVAEISKAETDFTLPEGYRLDMETVQLQVSRSKKAGNSHLMFAENPVYIFRLRLKRQIIDKTEGVTKNQER